MDNKRIGETLRKARGNMSLREFSKICGISHTHLDSLEKGIDPRTGNAVNITWATLQKIAEFTNTPVEYLMNDVRNTIVHRASPTQWEKDNLIPAKAEDFTKIPLIGVVRAGIGGVAYEEPLGYELTEISSLTPGEEYFWLLVKGDSMSPKLDDGDKVLVKVQNSVDSGSLAVVVVDGEEGLIKKVVYGEDWIELQSINLYYHARRFEGPEVTSIQVIGLAKEVKRTL